MNSMDLKIAYGQRSVPLSDKFDSNICSKDTKLPVKEIIEGKHEDYIKMQQIALMYLVKHSINKEAKNKRLIKIMNLKESEECYAKENGLYAKISLEGIAVYRKNK